MNPFRRIAGRYMEAHCKQPIEVQYIGIRPVYYPVAEILFSAGDAELQKIYDTAVYTLRCCMHEHYEDCLWREQALYIMDSRNQMLCGYYAFEDGNQAYARHNLELISKSLRPDVIACHMCAVGQGRTYVVTFTVSPESDYYEIVAVKVNGTTVTGTDGTYSQVYGDSNLFEITVETKVVKSDVTFALGYEDGAAIDASKVSLQGAQITLTNKVDESDTHTVTVETSNAVPEIKGLKIGATYGVTTTAMNGKLKVKDFVCDGIATKLQLQLANNIAGNGSYKLGLCNVGKGIAR